jgi:hypothetical protein
MTGRDYRALGLLTALTISLTLWTLIWLLGREVWRWIG